MLDVLQKTNTLTKGTIQLDFSKVDFIHPFFILPIHCLRNELKSKGIKLNLVNISKDTESYLDTISFEKGYRLGSKSKNQKPFNFYHNKNYIPIVSFSTGFIGLNMSESSNKETVLSKINSLLKRQLDLRGDYNIAMRYLISEMTDNIVEHARVKKGWVFAHFYREKGGFLDLCIVDNGHSILGSYDRIKAKNPKNDIEAMELALQGVSTKGKERGYGIRTSRNMLEEGLKGNFIMISGNAMLIEGNIIQMPTSCVVLFLP